MVEKTNLNGMMKFGDAIRQFSERKVDIIPQRLHIKIPNAKLVLKDGLSFFLGSDYKWLPEYENVANWLTDNKGMGLCCMGNCGRGKSVICLQIIPCIMQHYLHLIPSLYLAREMNRHYQEVMQKKLLIIDDAGCEEPYQEYGNHYNVFPDYVDDCERRGKFLVTNTNCTKEQLAIKYGERTLSRLKVTTRLIVFAGEDLRHGFKGD